MSSRRQSTDPFDHVVAVMFENRSFDNLLGRLYQPGEVQSFDGVIGKHLSNPVPSGARSLGTAPLDYGIPDSMDTPNPDPGEGFHHTNMQLFGYADVTADRTSSGTRRRASMAGFVADYADAWQAARHRVPTRGEVAQIMTGYTPEQVPVISSIARSFATFDHWFCDVPSETFPNRAFFHAADSAGFVDNTPVTNFPLHNDCETIFERLDAAGLPWRIYVDAKMHLSVTGLLHFRRLARFFPTNFSSLDDFFDDAEHGRLPAYSFIEPNLIFDHDDYHPSFAGPLAGHSTPTISSITRGEAFLGRLYQSIRESSSPTGSNFSNTFLLVAFDEHGGTYDHVAPPSVLAPTPGLTAGQYGFGFDRAGVRVPAIAVSAMIEPATVSNDLYLNTSLISTLRRRWPLGPPLSARDAQAADLWKVLTRETPRPQEDWPDIATPLIEHVEAAQDRPLHDLGRAVLGCVLVVDGAEAVLDHREATVGQAKDYLTSRSRKARIDNQTFR